MTNVEVFIGLCPFEGKLRDFLDEVIEVAQTFLYLFTETFFDESLVKRLGEKRIVCPNIVIKLITRPTEKIRQDPQKAKRMMIQLLSRGVEIGYAENIQGKYWVTDDWLALASGDLTKMNLGHDKGRGY